MHGSLLHGLCLDALLCARGARLRRVRSRACSGSDSRQPFRGAISGECLPSYRAESRLVRMDGGRAMSGDLDPDPADFAGSVWGFMPVLALYFTVTDI